MISASVHGKTGEMVLAISHPEYIDFGVRMPSVTTSEGRIDIHDENYVAPIVAGLSGKTAIETYPDLTRALADITAKHPAREDAKVALQTLVDISRPHPEARWHIAGADRVPRHVRYVEIATMPRFFASAKTASGERGYRIVDGDVYVRLEDGWRRSTEGIRQNAIDVDAGDVIKLGPKWEEISGAALLQREIRIQPTGGGTRSKNRKKPPKAGDLPLTGSSGGYDEPKKREVLGVRISSSAKTALQTSGVARELIEALGLAIASGRTIEEVRAALEDTAK